MNISLAGDAYYFGKLYKKKTIGDNNRPIENDDIKKIKQADVLYICFDACSNGNIKNYNSRVFFMKKYQHGGNTNIKYDFSANINPLGMPENVKKFLLKM